MIGRMKANFSRSNGSILKLGDWKRELWDYRGNCYGAIRRDYYGAIRRDYFLSHQGD